MQTAEKALSLERFAQPNCFMCEFIRGTCSEHRQHGFRVLLPEADSHLRLVRSRKELGVPTFRELADEWLATEGARLVEP